MSEVFDSIKSSKRNLVNLIILLVLVISLPLVFKLVKETQIFKPKAASYNIEVIQSQTVTTTQENGQPVIETSTPDIQLKLNSPLDSEPTTDASFNFKLVKEAHADYKGYKVGDKFCNDIAIHIVQSDTLSPRIAWCNRFTDYCVEKKDSSNVNYADCIVGKTFLAVGVSYNELSCDKAGENIIVRGDEKNINRSCKDIGKVCRSGSLFGKEGAYCVNASFAALFEGSSNRSVCKCDDKIADQYYTDQYYADSCGKSTCNGTRERSSIGGTVCKCDDRMADQYYTDEYYQDSCGKKTCSGNRERSKSGDRTPGASGSGAGTAVNNSDVCEGYPQECDMLDGSKGEQFCSPGKKNDNQGACGYFPGRTSCENCHSKGSGTSGGSGSSSVSSQSAPVSASSALSGSRKVTTCKGEISLDQLRTELQAAGYNGSWNESAAVAGYNNAACPTAPADCKDNPPVGGSIGDRPDGYIWKASCTKACIKNSDCPQNTQEPFRVRSSTSNWCYGFGGGNRCLQLVSDPSSPIWGKPASGSQPSTPAAPATTSVSWNPPACDNSKKFSGCNVTGQAICTDFGSSTYSNWNQGLQAKCANICARTIKDSACTDGTLGTTQPPAQPAGQPGTNTPPAAPAVGKQPVGGIVKSTCSNNPPVSGIEVEITDNKSGQKKVLTTGNDGRYLTNDFVASDGSYSVNLKLDSSKYTLDSGGPYNNQVVSDGCSYINRNCSFVVKPVAGCGSRTGATLRTMSVESPKPVQGAEKRITKKYRIAEDAASFTEDSWRDYTLGGITIPYSFSKFAPNGVGFLFIQFQDDKGNIVNANPYPMKVKFISSLSGGSSSYTPPGTCPLSNTQCCYQPLQTCTTNSECPAKYQWCYSGYCINQNYNESTGSCPVPAGSTPSQPSGSNNVCTVGKVCGDNCGSGGVGKCDECNGGWCAGGQCKTCSDGSSTVAPTPRPFSCSRSDYGPIENKEQWCACAAQVVDTGSLIRENCPQAPQQVATPTPEPTSTNSCTVGQACSNCGDDPGHCYPDCNGGWCNGGVCATCQSDR